MMIARWVMPVGLLLLTGCAATVPQYRYYTLDMAPNAGISAPIEVASVRISVNEALSRPEILIRTSPTSVEYYALDRWASGLQDQLAEKLKTEFGRPGADPVRLEISGTLMAFEQVDVAGGAEVRVKLDSTLIVTVDGNKDGFNRLYVQSLPASAPSADPVVQALSRAVEAIAAQIASDVEQFIAAR